MLTCAELGIGLCHKHPTFCFLVKGAGFGQLVTPRQFVALIRDGGKIPLERRTDYTPHRLYARYAWRYAGDDPGPSHNRAVCSRDAEGEDQGLRVELDEIDPQNAVCMGPLSEETLCNDSLCIQLFGHGSSSPDLKSMKTRRASSRLFTHVLRGKGCYSKTVETRMPRAVADWRTDGTHPRVTTCCRKSGSAPFIG